MSGAGEPVAFSSNDAKRDFAAEKDLTSPDELKSTGPSISGRLEIRSPTSPTLLCGRGGMEERPGGEGADLVGGLGKVSSLNDCSLSGGEPGMF